MRLEAGLSLPHHHPACAQYINADDSPLLPSKIARELVDDAAIEVEVEDEDDDDDWFSLSPPSQLDKKAVSNYHEDEVHS